MAPNPDRVLVSVEPVVDVKKRVVLNAVPVVLVKRVRVKKSGRRRYSKGLLYPIGVAEHRLLGGLGRAADDYRKRSDDSATERRDGAVYDFMKNAARSSEEFVSQAAKVPSDIMRSRPFKDGWKAVRCMTRLF